MNQAVQIAILVIPIVIAITLHEAAHGYVARAFGDPTAENMGRITLNPLAHIDLLGTVILPVLLVLSHAGFLFGYAKPVPVDPSKLRNPRRDMVWVAAAGPAMNLLLALISAVLLLWISRFAPDVNIAVAKALWISVHINLVLAVLNLIPIPPLDGSKVVAGLLPLKLAAPYMALNRFGMLIVFAVFILLPLAGVNVFPWLIGRPVQAIEQPIQSMVGMTA